MNRFVVSFLSGRSSEYSCLIKPPATIKQNKQNKEKGKRKTQLHAWEFKIPISPSSLNSAEDEQTGWEKDRKPLVTGDGNFSDKLGTKQYNLTKWTWCFLFLNQRGPPVDERFWKNYCVDTDPYQWPYITIYLKDMSESVTELLVCNPLRNS